MELSNTEPTTPDPDQDPNPFFDAFDDFPFFNSLSDATWLKPEPKPAISDELSSLTELKKNPSKQPKEPAFRSPRLRRRHPKPSKTPETDPVMAAMRLGVIEVVPEEEGSSRVVIDSAPEVVRDVLRTRRGRRSGGGGNIGAEEVEETGFLVFVAGLVIKAVTFQISLLEKSFSVPIWLLYRSFMFMCDPGESLKKWKCGVMEKLNKLWSGICESFAPYLSENKSFWNLVGKFGWGVVWVGYVCFVLFGFVVIGFVMDGVVMRCIVEEPIRMTEVLNFDYTYSSPVALVDIMGCKRDMCGLNCMEMVDGGKNTKGRIFPLNHKVQLTVSLILPESEYNRKLGIFQVRANFLSDNGRVTDSSRRPVMLN